MDHITVGPRQGLAMEMYVSDGQRCPLNLAGWPAKTWMDRLAPYKLHRQLLGRLHQAILKAVHESQTFWIPSGAPVRETLATLLDTYGLSLREHLSWGHETERKRLPGGLAAAVVK